VLQRGVNDAGALALVERFRRSSVVLRFIEFMDVGNRTAWSVDSVVSSQELHARIHARWPLMALPPRHPGEVATRYRFVDGGGEIGLISSISTPFCGDCTRARLSSEGQLYTCLFATRGSDLRGLLRASADDATLRAVLAGVWSARNDRYSELRGRPASTPGRRIEMHYIGG